MKKTARRLEADHFFEKAYDHQMASQYKAAILCYKKSLEIYPTAEAYTFLGWTYSFMGCLDEAIKECEKAIQLEPEYGNPYNDIGVYLIEKGCLDDAMRYLHKAIRAKRYDSRCFAHYNLGRVWEKKGDLLKAMKCYHKAVKLNPQYFTAHIALRRLEGVFN